MTLIFMMSFWAYKCNQAFIFLSRKVQLFLSKFKFRVCCRGNVAILLAARPQWSLVFQIQCWVMFCAAVFAFMSPRHQVSLFRLIYLWQAVHKTLIVLSCSWQKRLQVNFKYLFSQILECGLTSLSTPSSSKQQLLKYAFLKMVFSISKYTLFFLFPLCSEFVTLEKAIQTS